MTGHVGSLAILAAFLCTGCAVSVPVSSSPSPISVPETAPQAVVKPTETTNSWRLTPTSQTQTYSSLITTVVSEVDGLTPRRDSLTAEIKYSISTARRSDSLSFSGLVRSFTVRGTTPEVPEPESIFPMQFTGSMSLHSIQIQKFQTQAAPVNPCSDGSQTALTAIERTLFILPLELTNQQTWTDSTSSIVCNGTLPLTIIAIRSFRVIGQSELDDLPVLLIDQDEKTFSNGEGSQGQHRIFVETQGSTSGHLYVDLTSGELVSMNLTNKTSLTVRSSGRVQQFQQNSTALTQRSR